MVTYAVIILKCSTYDRVPINTQFISLLRS